MKALVAQISANPFRDLGNYPFSRQKIDGLKESITQTSFWDNLLARPAGNTIDPTIMGDAKTLSAFLSGLDKAYLDDGTFLFTIELAYGHHRLEAVKELGITEIDIPVKEIDDTTMLRIMANENKGDWASNMSVILETVRQSRVFLETSVAPYATYEEYKAAGNTFFSKEQFAQIPTQGIGFKPIQRFLGDTWAENDVRKAVAVLKDIDSGLYDQSQIVAFPSVGVLGGFSKLAGAIHKQAWPEFFKDKMVNELAEMIADPAVSTTVKILTSATAAASNGKDPVRVIRSPGQKQQDFSVVKAIKALAWENMDPKTKLNLDDLPNVDGFKDFPDLDKIIEEVRKSINRSEAAKKAVDTGQPQTTEDGIEITPEVAADQEALEALVSGAESEVQTAAAADGTLPPVDGDDEVVGADSGVAVFDRFIQSSAAIVKQTDDVTTALEGGAESPEGGALESALETVANSVMAAFVAAFGVDDAIALVSAMQPDETETE